MPLNRKRELGARSDSSANDARWLPLKVLHYFVTPWDRCRQIGRNEFCRGHVGIADVNLMHGNMNSLKKHADLWDVSKVTLEMQRNDQERQNVVLYLGRKCSSL